MYSAFKCLTFQSRGTSLLFPCNECVQNRRVLESSQIHSTSDFMLKGNSLAYRHHQHLVYAYLFLFLLCWRCCCGCWCCCCSIQMDFLPILFFNIARKYTHVWHGMMPLFLFQAIYTDEITECLFQKKLWKSGSYSDRKFFLTN